MSEPSLDTICAAVSGAEMMENLRALAAWQKLSGTPEELDSLRFVESRLVAYGYATRLVLHDAYISLPGAARVEVNGQPLAAITHSFSRPSPPGGLRGDIVYLGAGTEADFAGEELQGKILLLEGMATPATADRARRAGVAGLVHISHHEHRHEMCISPVWGSPSAETLHCIPSAVVVTLDHADGTALRASLARGERPRITIQAEVDTGWRKTPLLIAELPAPGADPETPFILLSGHHDTWYFGVMDNGSANAGMLEAARLCAMHRAGWKRSLRICFWSGHSHGRYSGSAWYADTHWDELDRRCAAHVNVDSLGGIGATELANAAAMAELAALAAEAVQTQSGQPWRGKRKARNSDESFVGIGVPSMFGSISEQPPGQDATRNHLGWWWHTPHDLLDKIDEANLVRDTRVLLHATWRLLADPVLPLDHAASAQTLLMELGTIGSALHGRFPLDHLVAAAEVLSNTAEAVQALKPTLTAAQAARVNRCLMRASRALVPMDYATGDRFGHPAALPLPPWAVLQKLREFAAADPDTDAARFLEVDANRARNRVVFALREATAALYDALRAAD